MSDYTDPNYVDPDTELLIQQLAYMGINPNPALGSVPYAQDYIGGNTDPLRQIKSEQSLMSGADKLLGFNPIEQFGGPATKLYVPEADQVAKEVGNDPLGQALLQDLNNGSGVLELKKKILANTYDPTKEDKPNANALTRDEANTYNGWLDRMSKALAKDNFNLSKPGVTDNPQETDPFGNVPTPEAQSFNTEDYVNQIARQGTFGQQRQRYASQPAPRHSSFEPLNVLSNAQQYLPPAPSMGRAAYGSGNAAEDNSPVGRATARGQQYLEQAYTNAANRAQQGSTQASMANQRAYRNIVAYRVMMGLSPT